MLFSHATSCYQVTPLQAIFPISRSFRWKQKRLFFPRTNNFFQSLWYNSGKKRLWRVKSLDFPLSLDTQRAIADTFGPARGHFSVFCFSSMQSFYFKRSNFTDSHASGTRHCYIVGRGLPAKGPRYILLSQIELWSGERLKSLRTKTTSA